MKIHISIHRERLVDFLTGNYVNCFGEAYSNEYSDYYRFISDIEELQFSEDGKQVKRKFSKTQLNG